MTPKHNTIFSKIMYLSVTMILITSTLIAVTCSFISEKILLKKVIENSYTNLTSVQNELLNYNTEVLNAISHINKSTAFKNYITQPDTLTPLEQLNLVMSLGKYLDTYKDYLSPGQSHLIVSGISSSNPHYYANDTVAWNLLPDDFFINYLYLDGTIPNQIRYQTYQSQVSQNILSKNYILATKPLINLNTKNLYGYVAIALEERQLFKKYSPFVTEGIQISLVSKDGTTLSSSNPEQIATTYETLLTWQENILPNQTKPTTVFSKAHQTTLALYLPFYEAYLIEEINHPIAFASLYRLRKYISLLVLITLLLSYFITRFISKRMTMPLHALATTMHTAVTHHFKPHPLNPKSTMETQMITLAYNTMANDINSYVNKLLKEEEKRRKSELQALQMQINPHFLYNTLSSIKYLTKSNQISQVDHTIDSLINILQNTIGSTDELTTIENEINILKDYVYINHMRYGEGIKVHYEVASHCLPFKIPKLMIQPFIENAFFHGFTGLDSGHITLFINTFNDILTIEIVDNGIGMSTSNPIPKKHHFSGIGIHNVDERLKLLYGADYGIHIQSELGYGTNITITLPVIS